MLRKARWQQIVGADAKRLQAYDWVPAPNGSMPETTTSPAAAEGLPASSSHRLSQGGPSASTERSAADVVVGALNDPTSPEYVHGGWWQENLTVVDGLIGGVYGAAGGGAVARFNKRVHRPILLHFNGYVK